MAKPPILQVNYRDDAANLQVTPHLPQLSSHRSGWRYIGLQHHIQPPLQTPKFQPLQHLLVIHLRPEVGVERNLGGSFRRGNNLPGDITIVPANCDYQLTTAGESEVLLLTLDPRWVAQLAPESIASNSLEIVPHFPHSDPLIYGIGLTLHAELKSQGGGDSLYVESLCHTLSLHLLKRYSWQPYALPDLRGGLPRYRLSQVLDYIHSHLDREITVMELSAIAHLSRYHFASLFKQSTGVSPYQYVLRQRVDRAKRLLNQQELSLADIASACGFANQSHFIRRFRQLTGVTPKTYRDALRV